MLKLYDQLKSIEIKLIKMEMNSDYHLQIRKHYFFLASKNSSIKKKDGLAPGFIDLSDHRP